MVRRALLLFQKHPPYDNRILLILRSGGSILGAKDVLQVRGVEFDTENAKGHRVTDQIGIASCA